MPSINTNVAVTTGHLNLTIIPPLGHIHVCRDQLYFLVNIRHENVRYPLIWQTHCAVCGVPFTLYSGMKSNGFSRRCSEHKKAGMRIRANTMHEKACVYITAAPETMAVTLTEEKAVKPKERGGNTVKNPDIEPENAIELSFTPGNWRVEDSEGNLVLPSTDCYFMFNNQKRYFSVNDIRGFKLRYESRKEKYKEISKNKELLEMF